MTKKNAVEKIDPRAPIESMWRDQTRYNCPFDGCGADSLYLPIILEHIAIFHPKPEVLLPVDLLELDGMPSEIEAAKREFTDNGPKEETNNEETEK